ncbi:hypothetical protein QE152_g16011 [Popillia japonica]|uniref:Uncharacterized protein n=1 Tax=Popillia japonica TaxID=7064 RepID=A0AAW1L5Y4_POPJA
MSSKIPEILLRNAVTMFVDDEYVNIRRNKEQQQIQSCVEYTQQNKFSRSKSLKESFKITFKRSSIITRSFTRSKSSECASEDERQSVLDRRAASADDARFSAKPVPTPLVVEDPPSSENGSDLDDVKYHNNPALLDG